MKKITLLVLLLVSTVSFGQLKKVEEKPTDKGVEIGKIQPMGQPVHMSCTKYGEDVYAFTYLDGEFLHNKTVFHTFIFKDIDGAFNSLYDIIIKGFEEMPKEPIKLELDKEFLWIHFQKDMGIKLVYFESSYTKDDNSHKGISRKFTKKQIEKLFGKK